MTDETRPSNGFRPGTETKSILPGSVVGVLGGGQLGRMLAIAARRMGYRVHAFDPQRDCPAGQVCDVEVNADYLDRDAVETFAKAVDVVSFEFENIPIEAISWIERTKPVRPRGEVLHVCQNREREKRFLEANGFPCAPFRVVDSADSLARAVEDVGPDVVLKTADFGYDGKGQLSIRPGDDAHSAWAAFGAPRGVVESRVPFATELSVVCARGMDGQIAAFPVSENVHARHILDLSIVPARFDDAILDRARSLAGEITRALDVVGLLAVEMFLCADGEILVNELAPRPHNSGHFTFDACVTSQFEQQLRAVCGLPLGSTELLRPVVMWNLLGDLWSSGEPDWRSILEEPCAKLHLYGKPTARAGRKMGHVCVMADSVSEALEAVGRIRRRLSPVE